MQAQGWTSALNLTPDFDRRHVMFDTFGDYLVPLLNLIDNLPGREGQTSIILRQFEERHRGDIPSAHYGMNASGNVKWKWHVHWSRQKAVQLGFVDSPRRGIWRLTDTGHRWLVEHPDAARLDGTAVRRRKGKPRAIRATDRVDRSRYKSFFASVEQVLTTTLPDDVRALAPAFQARSNWLQMHVRPYRGCHYEIRLAREYHEIALHFESSQKRNEARRRAFEPHLESLSSKLGKEVSAEAWGRRGWTRVWIKLPIAALSDRLAEDYARLAAAFVSETFPVLKAIRAGKSERRSEGQSILSGHYAILDREIEAIHAFLEGRTDHRPSDEKLCDWVQLCYMFELYADGRDLFALMSPEGVNQWYFDRTKKLAQICKMKAQTG